MQLLSLWLPAPSMCCWIGLTGCSNFDLAGGELTVALRFIYVLVWCASFYWHNNGNDASLFWVFAALLGWNCLHIVSLQIDKQDGVGSNGITL